MDKLNIFEILLNVLVLIVVIIATIWHINTECVTKQTKIALIITVWTVYLINLAMTIFLLLT